MTSTPHASLEIEPAKMKDSGACGCCGRARRTVWGFVYRDGGPRACYFVEWTPGTACSARFDVVIGDWNDGTTERDRDAVSLQYGIGEGPLFSIVDAAGRPAAEAGRPARPSDVAGTALADEALSIAARVLTEDARVHELSQRRLAG
jgi:hypothetical protein